MMNAKRAEKYFQPRRLKRPILWLVFGLLLILGGAASAPVVLGIGIFLAACAALVLYRRIHGRPTDAEIDAEIARRGSAAHEQGLKRLGLVPEQVSLADPLIIPCPDFDDSKGKVKKGKDGFYRSAANHVVVMYFGEHELNIYDYNFSLVDTDLKSENTEEYFYKDVVAVRTSTKEEKITLDKNKKPIDVTTEQFTLATAGGPYEFGVYRRGSNSDLDESIRAMRSLIKEKKQLV